MKKRDHLALGRFLIDKIGTDRLINHRKAFLLGCIEPDCNFLTYCRGFSLSDRFPGHTARIAEKLILKCISRFAVSGLSTALDYFILGTLLHYAADAFTGAHNAFMDFTLAEHLAYENELHEMIEKQLLSDISIASPCFLDEFFITKHSEYVKSNHSVEIDAHYIILVTASLLSGILAYEKGRGTNEGAYYYRLV